MDSDKNVSFFLSFPSPRPPLIMSITREIILKLLQKFIGFQGDSSVSQVTVSKISKCGHE